MIHYALKCADGHQFESWFQSAGRFDELLAGGHVSCAICGSSEVAKAIMTPRVRASRETEQSPSKTPMASTPADHMRAKLEAMRKEVEANSEYVGSRFAREARAMHLGEAPARAIYGEARGDEAKALIDDGVPVLPLPFRPTKTVN